MPQQSGLITIRQLNKNALDGGGEDGDGGVTKPSLLKRSRRKFQGRDGLLKKEKSDTWSILFDYFALHTMHWIESFVSSTTLVRN
jgi:hypothetical protein